MLDHHSVFSQELERLQHFAKHLKRHGYSPSADGTSEDGLLDGGDGVLQHVAVALEDIPEDMHDVAKMVLMRPTESTAPTDPSTGTSLRACVEDVARNLGGDILGHAELLTEQLSRLHILACLHYHTPYTYRVDHKLIRGARPTVEKIKRLSLACHATVNLCAEMLHGDSELIEQAGVEMDTTHEFSWIDNTAPEDNRIVDGFIDFVSSSPGTVYVHCEAGAGRTGVAVACYRLSQGWDLKDALHEANNFGCHMPDQLAFVEKWANERGKSAPQAQVDPSKLQETATLNKDTIGLDRALA